MYFEWSGCITQMTLELYVLFSDKCTLKGLIELLMTDELYVFFLIISLIEIDAEGVL